MSNETNSTKKLKTETKIKKEKRLKLNIRDHLNENETIKSMNYYSIKPNDDTTNCSKNINDLNRNDQFSTTNSNNKSNDSTSTINRVRLLNCYIFVIFLCLNIDESIYCMC